jgi:hypothetical protein
VALALVASVAGGAFASATTAGASVRSGRTSAATAAGPTYTYATLDSSQDPTFNQLLGINDQQVIAGYFGSGTPPTTNPNHGYTIDPPYGQANYTNENFPGSQQTQVVAINDFGNTAGFYTNTAEANFGFYTQNGKFYSVTDPATTSSPKFNQLLGRNNNSLVVGFYNDAAGNSHAYEYNVKTKVFTAINPPGAVSAAAAGINDENDVVGFLTTSSGAMKGFLWENGTYSEFEVHNSAATAAFGVNDIGQVVGSYTAGGVSEGFIRSASGAVTTISDPSGVGGTVLNGINNGGSVVGFYIDAAGNTDGLLAVPTPTPVS